MTEQEFRQIVDRGHETPGVEFKTGGARSGVLFARVVRAVIAMANRRGGGHVIIGVREEAGRLVADGVPSQDLASWHYDKVTGALDAYVDPYVETSVQELHLDGRTFVVIAAAEFEDVPILCKKDYEAILQSGACYVRRRGRVESSHIPNHSEMRDLIELATEKGVRRFLRTASRTGLVPGGPTSPTDEESYASELKDFE